MCSEIDVAIYVPSYRRYSSIKTQKIVESCTYVIRESERPMYEAAGVEKIIALDDSLIDSEIKVYEWMIKNTPEPVIVIMDDDIKDFTYRTDRNILFGQDKEMIMGEIERIAQIIIDLDIGYASLDVTSRPFGYDAEFAFKGTSSGIKWINKKVYKAKADTDVAQNYDLDIVLQELLANRIVLHPKYLCDIAELDKNAGGSSVGKVRSDQLVSIDRMMTKWGKYFDFDFGRNVPSIRVTR